MRVRTSEMGWGKERVMGNEYDQRSSYECIKFKFQPILANQYD
jgi:hypothetical protein